MPKQHQVLRAVTMLLIAVNAVGLPMGLRSAAAQECGTAAGYALVEMESATAVQVSPEVAVQVQASLFAGENIPGDDIFGVFGKAAPASTNGDTVVAAGNAIMRMVADPASVPASHVP